MIELVIHRGELKGAYVMCCGRFMLATVCWSVKPMHLQTRPKSACFCNFQKLPVKCDLAGARAGSRLNF